MYEEIYSIDTTPDDLSPCIKCKGICKGNTKLFLFPGEYEFRKKHGLEPNDAYQEDGNTFVDCKFTGLNCDPTVTCKCSPLEVFIDKKGIVEKLNIVPYCEKQMMTMRELQQTVLLINKLIEGLKK